MFDRSILTSICNSNNNKTIISNKNNGFRVSLLTGGLISKNLILSSSLTAAGTTPAKFYKLLSIAPIKT